MTDRPIIFSGPMIEAIVAGRKTMTRRLLKQQPEPFRLKEDDPHWGNGLKAGDWCPVDLLHVHGEPWPRVTLGRVITRQEVRFALGMRLWVRETWKPHSLYAGIRPRDIPESNIFYAADHKYSPSNTPWRPSIFMPRWASRITLTVTVVKVERLQDISEEDAKAEGVEPVIAGREGWSTPIKTYRTGFVKIWNTIHGEKAWLDNPYVVAVSFEAALRNIDHVSTEGNHAQSHRDPRGRETDRHPGPQLP